MRQPVLLLAALLLAGPAHAAQAAGQTTAQAPRSTSSPGASQSPSQDDREDRDNRDGPHWELPVSLDRIREGLDRLPAKPLLGSIDIQADFRVSIEERRHLELMIERLAIEPTPSPPGGLYYYEIQRLVRNPVDHPLEQPYAAFSPGELVQVAATSILSRLLMQHGAQGFQSISRGAADKAAKAEVRRAIEAYCAAVTTPANVAICKATLLP